MLAWTHMAAGAAAAASAAIAAGVLPPELPLVAVAIGGALLPDIDHPQSFLGRRVLPVAAVLGGLLGHRTVTHSLLGQAGVALAFLFLPWQLGLALALGYGSHLLADSCTRGGIPLLWPNRRLYGPRLMRTGGLVELLVVLPACALGSALLLAVAMA